MALNDISREEMLEVFAEAHGDQEKAFDEIERRMRLGKTRFFMAECETCEMKMPFEEQSNRDTWAKIHSQALHTFQMPDSDEVQTRTVPVRVFEEWR
jgi:hypothetical protein